MQDVEFTIEDGRLWVLQTRSAKRTPRAALRIAIDLVHEGLISRAKRSSELPDIDPAALVEVSLVSVRRAGLARDRRVGRDRGRPRRLLFRERPTARASGDPVILMRPDTSTADVAGFAVSAGIVTAVGGRTAHAALVARQMGKPCMVGCAGMTVESPPIARSLQTISEGDWITIDGDSGRFFSDGGKPW